MNYYATLDNLKARLNWSGTAQDEMLMEILDEASRAAEAACSRVFYAVEGVREYRVESASYLRIDDMLRVDGIEVREGADDSDEWTEVVEGDDFRIENANKVPKVALTAINGFRFPIGERRLRLSGLFGYGDGMRAVPRSALAATVTVDDASNTISGVPSNILQAGMTIRVDSEDMFVASVRLNEADVIRGVNGTTPAAHSNAQVSLWQYPAVLRSAVLLHAGTLWGLRASPDLIRQRIGDYEEQRRANINHDDLLVGRLQSLRKIQAR